MEQLFYSIQQHIAANMPVLSTIDEDYGQLQTDEDTYPVTFPCVLINAEQTDWESLSGGVQRGKCTVVITWESTVTIIPGMVAERKKRLLNASKWLRS